MDVFSGPYRGEGQPTSLFDGSTAIIPRIINLMLFIVGVLAIFMMIYGGIRYVLSGGDNNKVKDAKKHHSLRYCWSDCSYTRLRDCQLGCLGGWSRRHYNGR